MGTKPAISVLERREQISRFVEKKSRVSVNEISERFAVSMVIARKDLDELSAQGKIQRVRGGALHIAHAPPEPPVIQRLEDHSTEKEQIGRAAATLVCESETIFLGSGSTILEVAKNLPSCKGLTIITNSLPVLNVLADVSDISVVAIGGMFRKNELSFSGYISEDILSKLHVNKVFIGVRAIDIKHGITNDFLGEMTTDRAIINCGEEVIVVADHTKCGRVSTAFIAPISVVTTLITDQGIPTGFSQGIRSLGIRHIIA
jgi:DeoR family transcriptional regulator, aga operon transcriptional repressor